MPMESSQHSGTDPANWLKRLCKHLDANKRLFVGIAKAVLKHEQDSEDAFGEFCLECIRRISSTAFDNYPNWNQLLTVISYRQALTILHRRNQLLPFLEEDFESSSAVNRAGRPDEVAEANERAEKVRVALRKLSPDERESLLLSEYQAYTYKHIAELLDVTEGVVRGRIYRAKLRLREELPSFTPEARTMNTEYDLSQGATV